MSVALNIARRVIGGGLQNEIAAMFAASEPGALFDPSDRATLFQDAAGTTPVTGVEQPVGLMLDKSRGLALGPELVTNGEFSSGLSGWYIGSSVSAAVVGGEAQVTLAGSISSSANNWFASGAIVLDGDWSFFCIEFDATWVSGAGSLQVGSTYYPALTIAPNAGKTRYRIPASSIRGGFGAVGIGASVVFGSTAAAVWRIDNVSCKRLPGNHAFQPTAPARPTLSARVNLLERTEQFQNAAWNKFATGTGTSAVVTDNYLGVSGETRIQLNRGAGDTLGDDSGVSQPISVVAGVSYSLRFQAKANIPGDVGKQVAVRQAGAAAYTLFTLQADWADVSNLETAPLTFSPAVTISLRGSFGASQTADFVVRRIQQVPANEASFPYQRVNTATDYDTAGFPMYLRFDGVDDWMQTGSINFTGTDKMLVAAGVRKLSDAATTVVAETAGFINGSFSMLAPNTAAANLAFWSRGTNSASAPTATTFPAPITAVLAGQSSIGDDQASLRVNGVLAASGSADQGTGNYGNHIVFIGSRAGSSLFFNGRLYGLIVRGGPIHPMQVIAAERWLAEKSGVRL